MVTNSGIAMTFHYCAGRYSRIEWGSGPNCRCKKPMHCCTSKTVVVKLKYSFQKSAIQATSNPAPQPIFVLSPGFNSSNNAVDLKSAGLWIGDSPPLRPDHISLNQVFRI